MAPGSKGVSAPQPTHEPEDSVHLADESSAEAQLIATQAAIAGILEAHVKVFETEFDEAWGTNPVCDQCRRMYPCDLRIALTDVLQDALHAREQKATAAAFVEASKIVAEAANEASGALRYGATQQMEVGRVLDALSDVLHARSVDVV